MAEPSTLDAQHVLPKVHVVVPDTGDSVASNDGGKNGELVAEDQGCPGHEQLLALEDPLRAVFEQYQKALEDLEAFTLERSLGQKLQLYTDEGVTKFYERLKAKLESPAFLEKLNEVNSKSLADTVAERTEDSFLENAIMHGSEKFEDQGSWDMISEIDLQSGEVKDARNCLDQESYVVITQEDIVEGMACFMAKYMSSLPQTKEMTPKQLQDTLKKAFCVSKKGKLRRLWDGSKKLYTAASWGATAVSLYNNPALVQAASIAFWASFRAITKFV